MGCTLCQTGRKPTDNYGCIPENGPILPVRYEHSAGLLYKRPASAAVQRSWSGAGMPTLAERDKTHERSPMKQPQHYNNCLETRFRTPRPAVTWTYSQLHTERFTDDMRSATESTFYESSTTSGSNALPRNCLYLSLPEFNKLDIVRRKSYLKHLLIDFIPSFKKKVSIISRIVNFTVSLEYCDLIFLEVLSSRKGTAVFRAKRRDRTDLFAVKCVEKEKTPNTEREYALLSSVTPHPLIISIAHSGRIETPRFNILILEVVGEGITLHHKVHQQCGMNPDEVKFYTIELLAALSFLHDQGWLHRDVSLRNALLSPEGHIKLSDFDQCCRIGTTTERDFKNQHPFPNGLAPEQTNEEVQTIYADFWQLAWNIVWMRTGVLPKRISDVPIFTPSSLQFLCKSLLLEDLAERKNACQGTIKGSSYFEGVDWEKVSSANPPAPPCSPQQLDRRIDRASEEVYYTSIYDFLRH